MDVSCRLWHKNNVFCFTILCGLFLLYCVVISMSINPNCIMFHILYNERNRQLDFKIVDKQEEIQLLFGNDRAG